MIAITFIVSFRSACHVELHYIGRLV